MSANIVLVIITGALIAAGVYLLLERSLTRVLVGVIMISNGVNVLFLVASGRAGRAPIVGLNDPREMSDPIPQALVLTAIVITLAVTAFLLAMSYRAWQLNQNDDVQDDVEDALIRRLAELDEASASYDDSAGGMLEEEGADPVEEAGAAAGDTSRRVGPEGEHR